MVSKKPFQAPDSFPSTSGVIRSAAINTAGAHGSSEGIE